MIVAQHMAPRIALHASDRSSAMSMTVHPCPLLSKHLGEGAKTGCLYPQLLESDRSCTGARESIAVHTCHRETLPKACTGQRTNADQKRFDGVTAGSNDAPIVAPRLRARARRWAAPAQAGMRP